MTLPLTIPRSGLRLLVLGGFTREAQNYQPDNALDLLFFFFQFFTMFLVSDSDWQCLLMIQ